MAISSQQEWRDRTRCRGRAHRLWSEQAYRRRISKEKPLRLIAELLAREGVPYALIAECDSASYRGRQGVRSTSTWPSTYAHVPMRLLKAGSSIPVAPPTATLARPRSRTSQAADSGAVSAEDAGIADAVAHASVVDSRVVCSCASQLQPI